MKRLTLLVLTIALSLTISGCFGGGSGGGGIDDAEIQNAIASRISSFVTAVEDYDVDGMLEFLDEGSFSLTIAEGDDSYDKTYADLEAELEEDEAKQLHWRDAVSEGGHGYVLTMESGTVTYANLSETGAIATLPFTIREQADDPEIEETVTDTGSIICEVVKLQGQWLCRTMTITFDTDLPRALYRAAAWPDSDDEVTVGFGFGRIID